jgi:hypothetical protein
VAASERHADGPVSRSRHVGSAIILFGIAAFATWNVLNNGNWIEVVVPFSSQYRADVAGAGGLALIFWAGGLGLLTRTSVGLWLGRLEAAALLVLGAWFLWDHVVHPNGSTLYGDPVLLIVASMSALLMGAGIGMLVALRPRADRRATAGRSSEPEA